MKNDQQTCQSLLKFYGQQIQQLKFDLIPSITNQDQKARQNLNKALDRIQTNQNLKQLCQDFYPFGFVFFNNKINKKQNHLLFNQQALSMFQFNKFFITTQTKQQDQLWNLRFSFIKQVAITSFQYAAKNKNPQILKSIESIGFYKLTYLSLYSCGLQTIEPLSYLDAPNLQKINLIYNYHTQYKSLNKANFPNLNAFLIYNRSQEDYSTKNVGTPHIDMSNISRWNNSLDSLRLQKHNYNTTIIQDFSLGVKLKTNKNKIPVLFYMCFNDSNRIYQQKVYRKILRQRIIILRGFKNVLNPYTQQMERYDQELNIQQ